MVEKAKLLKYFTATGCIGNLLRMKDEEVDAATSSTLRSLNLKQRALGKIGLDEDQVSEIPPVHLHGYSLDRFEHGRIGKDGKARTNKYETIWLFFSDAQVYMYSYTFDLTSDNKKETTEEYFYKDIVSFSTSSETIDFLLNKREYNRFKLTVPGDSFFCSIGGVADAEQIIGAMKQKLREKKG